MTREGRRRRQGEGLKKENGGEGRERESRLFIGGETRKKKKGLTKPYVFLPKEHKERRGPCRGPMKPFGDSPLELLTLGGDGGEQGSAGGSWEAQQHSL